MNDPQVMEEATTASSFKIILGSSSVARRKILADMGYEFTVMSADIDEKGIRMENPEQLVMALAEAKASAVVSKLRTIDNQAKDDKQTLVIASDTEEAITPELAIGDHRKNAEPTLLLTCDQVVVYEGTIREKPSNKEEARQFIKGYSGAHAATVSSVLVTNLNTGFKKGDWDKVEIYFHDIPDHIIDKLIEEGTVLYVAGGLIIEHPLVLPYIKNVIYYSNYVETENISVRTLRKTEAGHNLCIYSFTSYFGTRLVLVQVGTTDSVMGLPKALTEKLIREAL